LDDLERQISIIIYNAAAQPTRNRYYPRIFAIKETRKITRWGLRESKEFVDDLADCLEVEFRRPWQESEDQI
jgi:hypothetical protein